MKRFRDAPIRRKLVNIVMITTAGALLTAGVGIIAADSILFRQYLQRDLAALAQIIADNSTAALAFNDSQAAVQTLAALRARPHVEGACTYRLNGTLLAVYERTTNFECPAAPHEGDGIRFRRHDIVALQTIVLNRAPVGRLVLFYDLGESTERMRLYGLVVLGVLLASSVLAFLLSSMLRGLIATPVSRLVDATTSVAQTGNYRIRAEKMSGDELGVLVDRFNEMLAGIESRDGQLREALLARETALRDVERERERFHFMAESMPQKIFTARPNGDVDYLNRQWLEYTGVPYDEMREWRWASMVHPDDREENLRAWGRSVETGEPFHLEHRFRRADGQYRWHLSRALAMRDANGNITMWIGSNTEIHEQKQKEDALRRANEDLQQFAYSASHDLQEPIRNVAVYSELVARRYHDRLDAEGQQFLGFLNEGGRRLATLVSDLLAYTRAGMDEVEIAPVDSSAVLKQALANLAEAIRESSAAVTWDLLPEVYMASAHLQQVFQNLMGNAIKYRKGEPPVIRVAAEERGSMWCFSVQDNGIGIDPRYREKIFGVFKRLHHSQKYGGTGIGLAICQRVVERYGGRIWVESEPGKGATFFFTIPQHARAISQRAV